jgi:hypothetical protein
MTRREPDELDFSVIFRLLDEHGGMSQTLGCLESWVRGQTHDRSRYEIIVVSDGTRPDLDDRARKLLTPSDSFIVRRTRQPFELYTLGARAARAEFLFIVESHSRGHADCLRAMRAYLERGRYDLAACRCIGTHYEGHWLSRLDRRMNDELLRTKEGPEAWRRVQLTGAAIRRSAYEAVGGFEHEFNKFAAIALSAKFKHAGKRIGFATDSVAYHVDSPDFGEFVGAMRDWILGEMAYRARYPADYCERYFGYAPQWALRGDHRPDLGRAIVIALIRHLPALLRRRGALGQVLRRLVELTPTAMLGWRWPLRRTEWAARWAVARAWLWRVHVARSYVAFEEARRHFDAHFRAAALEKHFSALPAPTAVEGRLALADVEADRLAGFLPVEQRPEGPFRWSTPAAAIEIALTPGDYRVRLAMLALRTPDQPADAAMYFDGHRLRRTSAEGDGEAVYSLERSMFRAAGCRRHTIALICTRFVPAHADSRELGLPLTSLTFEAG